MKLEYLMYLIIAMLIISSVLTVLVTRYVERGKRDQDKPNQTIWRWNPIYAIQILLKNGALTTRERILLYIPLCFLIVAIALAMLYKRQL